VCSSDLDVLDEQGRVLPPDAPCTPGQVLWYWRRLPPEPRVPFELALLHADEHLVVVDKPHFLAAIPGGRFLQETALVRLRRQLGNDDLTALHRLDRETAGVLMFSACRDTRDAYHALMREARVRKVYEAVAPWHDEPALPLLAAHRLHEPRDARHLPVQVVDGEPNAQVHVELIARLGAGLAHYRLRPLTGRRHQLRVQMNALGLPLVGDRIYPVLQPHENPPSFHAPLQLVARALAFTDPVTGLPRRFERTAATIAG
jgi:tRNA pseudouridine32 synthase/23S rRNA pseudouridine746 synthase